MKPVKEFCDAKTKNLKTHDGKYCSSPGELRSGIGTFGSFWLKWLILAQLALFFYGMALFKFG
jgi:hypothetical protein